MAGYNLKDESEVKEYIHNLGIEYRFGCYSEKKPEVCHLLGDFLEAIKKDFVKAGLVYKANCDDYNYGKSCFRFGNYSVVGKGLKQANTEQAYKYYLKACEHGEAMACLNAGMMNLKTGEYTCQVPNMELGATLLEKCCQENVGFCCHFLSGMHISGAEEAKVRKDMEKAYQYALKGCKLGEILACVNVSQMYKRGEGVEKNEELAAKFKNLAQELQDELMKSKRTLEFQQGLNV